MRKIKSFVNERKERSRVIAIVVGLFFLSLSLSLVVSNSDNDKTEWSDSTYTFFDVYLTGMYCSYGSEVSLWENTTEKEENTFVGHTYPQKDESCIIDSDDAKFTGKTRCCPSGDDEVEYYCDEDSGECEKISPPINAEVCGDYTEHGEDTCESDPSRIAVYTVDEEIWAEIENVCEGAKINETDDGEIWINPGSCKCSWFQENDDGKCVGDWGTTIYDDEKNGTELNGFKCVYNLESTECDDTGYREVTREGEWYNVTGEHYVDDEEDLPERYKDMTCGKESIRVRCLTEALIGFLSVASIIIAIVLIVLFYYFLKKKSGNKGNKKKVKRRGKKK